jgi:2-polyprenyl-3-methyl-5-hydroxy-6-metoxy-1,4-benzoquinol methylase
VIYERKIDLDSGDSLAKLARWVRPGASVLELGPAAGYFTEWLQQQGCCVDVVEIDPAAARHAQRFARRVVVADLDTDGWDDALGDATYDFVVCADVLEHLRDGQRLLERLRRRLRPDGELLLSVPNVAHASVIIGLLDDRFEYGGEGLLDPTHVRLYTWQSLAAALRAAGYELRAWDATEMTPWESEFRARVETLRPDVRAVLGPGTRHHAYQWLVRAVPGTGENRLYPPMLSGGERVPLRFLRAPSAGELSLERAETLFVPANGDPFDGEFRFEPGVQAMRIFLADRVGVINVEAFAMFAGEREVWRLGLPGGSLVAGPDAVPLDDNRFALVRGDAWIDPVLDAETAMLVDRIAIRARWIGDWSGAAAFSALGGLAEVVAARQEAAAARVQRLEAMIDERDRAIDARDQIVAATRAERDRAIDARDQTVATTRAESTARAAEIDRLEAALAAQERLIAYDRSLRGWLRLPWNRLRGWLHRHTGIN